MSGNLNKLVIHSYEDKKFQTKISSFTVPINPESFTKNFKIDLEKRSAHGSSGKDPKFVDVGEEQLKLDFILDGTGTMEGYFDDPESKKNPDKAADKKAGDKAPDKKAVSKALDNFLKCVNNYNGKIHRPNFLIIFWGSEIKFPCVLSNVDINHTLFDPQGYPIRVKISATFTGYYAPDVLTALNKISSTDLTHYKKVRAGDRLDLLTYQVYSDSKYFFQVAKANHLGALRNIKPGSNLSFPPFDKKDNNG